MASSSNAAPTGPSTPGHALILETAATLILEQGYEAASLRRIAEAAGIQAASIYHHFASKEALLEAILRRGMAVMDEAFTEAADLPDGTTDPRRRLAAHVRAHLAALYENGPFTAANVTTFRTAPAVVRSAIVPVRDAYEARWNHLLADLVADDVDVRPARLMLLGGMNASVEWFDPERGSLDELAEVVTRQFWSGLAARP